MYEALTNVGYGKGKMYIVWPQFIERLFPWLEPMPPGMLMVNLTVGPSRPFKIADLLLKKKTKDVDMEQENHIFW